MHSLQRPYYIVGIALSVMLIGGCQLLADFSRNETASKKTAQPMLPVQSHWDGLVDFTEWLHKQNTSTLHPLYEEAVAKENSDGNALDKLNLALLLSVPGTSFQNEKRALTLLEDSLAFAGEARGGVSSFARMQIINLETRRAMQDEIEFRKQQVAALQEQLEQLKAIERTLIERRELLDSP